MKGIRLMDYGGPELLKVESLPRPEPAANQVLVRMKSAGVNPIDWKLRSGAYKAFMPIGFPWTPGIDGSGLVEALGPGVEAFKPGQAVLGIFKTGAYAEYALAETVDLIHKPASLGFDEAATIPVGALTAWKAVVEDGQVSSGQRVLILGGSGGVGSFALQFARWKGAHVVVTASSTNADYLRSIGAETVIDRTKSFEKEAGEFDLVLDTIGGETLDRAYAVVKRGGILLTVAGQASPEKAEARGIRAQGSGRGPTDRLKQILDLVEQGKVRLRVGAVFPLGDARKAHELGQTGHGKGRIVLKIAD
jgi:NADPH:quinone reductase-like Zn-dependent oxidoreductase